MFASEHNFWRIGILSRVAIRTTYWFALAVAEAKSRLLTTWARTTWTREEMLPHTPHLLTDGNCRRNSSSWSALIPVHLKWKFACDIAQTGCRRCLIIDIHVNGQQEPQ
jgi:hypothetical protein